MTGTCPACAQPAAGRFCSHCGVSLEAPESCRECGNELPTGGRFCNQCGSPTPATRLALGAPEEKRPPSRLPWAVAGVAVIAAAAAVALPQLRPEEPPAAAAPVAAAAGAGDARSVDLSSMSPREAADRLFDRVMRNVSAGDTAQARAFLPMAIAAYERVPDIDLDGHYHVAVLQLVGGDASAARARADSILAEHPDHLFGLFTAAQAEQALGREEAARELYGRLLDRFDAESASKRPEYEAHAAVLPSMQEEAKRLTGR